MAGGRIKRIALAGWLISALSAGAAAQDGQTCAGASGDAGIAICTREITSGKYAGANLARRYYNRGVSYSAKEDTTARLPTTARRSVSIPRFIRPSSTAD
jgi:hypothetical protein